MFRLLKKNIKVGRATVRYEPGISKAPEGFLGAPEIDPEKCTGCGLCVKACPTDALIIKDDKAQDKRTFFLSYGDCIFCGFCESACPYQAISFKGKFELAAKSKEDLTFFFPFNFNQCEKDPAFVGQDALPFKRNPDFSQNFSKSDFAEKLSLDEIGSKLKVKIKSLLGRSLHIREVDAGSCNGCEIEAVNLSNPIYDAELFGIHFVASPRHADLLLVTGPVTRQMELALVKTYAGTADPKWVVACGSCAINGGIFQTSYAVVGGVDRSVPVDIYIPGCPPRPEAILYGIFLALGKIDSSNCGENQLEKSGVCERI